MKFLTTILILMISSGSIASDWSENIKLKGDFRLRHEMTDKEGSEIRNRERIRMRLGMTAKVNEEIKVNFQIASGGDDPVSTNQTLGDGFSSKSVVIDIASFDYAVTEAVGLSGGKMKNPFYVPVKSELLWDGDLRPEGASAKYSSGNLFVNGGIFTLDERKSDINALINAGQAGMNFDIGAAELIVGAGIYAYSNLIGAFNEDNDFFGNSSADSSYVCEYKLTEFFTELKAKVSGKPVSLYVDYVVNSGADENDTAFQYGFKIGKAKEVRSWDARVLYKEVEADAVFGLVTDSDFAGGGTGGKGYEMNFGYMFAKNAKLGVSYFMNEMIEDESEYNRLQVDLKLKF